MADKLVQLNPDDILATGNSRFGLKRFRLDRLKSEIVASGGVQTPVEVSPLPKNHESGKLYLLTAGFYRHQSIVELNADGAGGLMLPAIVHSIDSPVERLKRQLSENMERENQSPMDKAIAISLLMAENMPKMEIRKVFSVPGGRKGLTMQPASNSFINMTLSFLNLPKDVQAKIHDGRIGVAAAYELTKIAPDKREAVLDKIEAQRLAAIDADEAAETKFLEGEKKAAAAGEKVQAVVKEYEETAKEAESAATALEEAQKAETAAIDKAAELYKASKGKFATPEEKAAAEQASKDAYAAAKEAEKNTKKVEKEAEAAKKEADKLKEKVQTAEEKAAANKDRIAAARGKKKDPAAPPVPVSPKEVKRAGATIPGATKDNTYVALNANEMRKTINELTLAGTAETVQLIAVAIKECFDGKTTPQALYKALKVITGENEAPKGKTKK